ncbi:MAG TPA: hypothetical protein VGH37_03215 [Candidatus Acidoferrum sp.]
MNRIFDRDAQIDRQKSHGNGEDAVAESSEACHALTGNAIVNPRYG